MNIYETFNNLRYHYETEVVEFKKAENKTARQNTQLPLQDLSKGLADTSGGMEV